MLASQQFLHPLKMLISKSRNLEKVIRIKPNFSIILIKLRELLFSTVPTKIDDNNLKKIENKGSLEQIWTYSVSDSDRIEMIPNSPATAGYDQNLK